jgi:transposase
MDDKDELRRRRQAIRLWLKGISPSPILQRVQRGRTWLSKWRDRFECLGARGLGSQSRRPRHRPAAHSPQMVRSIVRTRRRLERERVGLIGPRAIRRELRSLRLGQRLPSLATIKRVLKAEGLTRARSPEPTAYRPS